MKIVETINGTFGILVKTNKKSIICKHILSPRRGSIVYPHPPITKTGKKYIKVKQDRVKRVWPEGVIPLATV